MSVGFSQVGFDPKVLEDEEEAVYEQEEKEREQEIRNLIINELDDNLLEDDNASFTSHDYRSTSNSRASQQLDDSDLHNKDNNWNSNEYANFPPRRGVFEKPPLMTERATGFISQSGGNHGNQQDDDGYHQGDEYQEYQEFGSYHGNSSDGNSNGHGDGVDHNNGYNTADGYPTMSNNDHYGNNDHYVNSNHYGNNEYHDNTDHYGNNPGYSGDMYSGERHYGSHHDPPETYQRDAYSGNYQVQYVPSYRPQNIDTQPSLSVGQHSPNSVWRDLRTQDTNNVDKNYNDDETNSNTTNAAQLQVLYQARGRKIQELSEKLNEREEELGRQIRVLNHQMIMLKDEHKGLSDSLVQSQHLVNDKQLEIKTIQDKLNTALKNNELLNKEKQELLDKFTAANSTIDCLNEQLNQLNKADSLAKAREQHETILNTVRQRQEEEILRLKQKLDDSQVALNWKTEEANRLRGEVMEKADIINRLNRTLDDSQRQCQELLKTGTVTEITNLRTQLQDTISAKSKVDLNCTALKSEVNSLKEELVIYQNALKYGSYGDQTTHNFKGEDVVRNLNSEDWATPRTHMSGNAPHMDALNGLRQELEHSLSLNQTKSKTIKDLEKTLQEKTEHLDEEKKKVERLEKIVVEQEVKVNTLQAQLNSKTADNDSESDLHKTLQELERRNQELKEKLEELQNSEEQLSEDNLNLKTQMAEMVAEFDEDKQISLDKCRDACLQLHEDAKEHLRQQLEQEKELALQAMRDELEKTNDELHQAKEAYLVLSEQCRTIEKRVQEEMKLTKNDSTAVDTVRTSLEKQYEDEMKKAREQWKKEQEADIEKMRKQLQEEKDKELEIKLKEAESKHAQQDYSNQLATVKKEWFQEHEQEMLRRISNAVNEARKTWQELERKNVKEQVEKAVSETKKTLQDSFDQEMAKALSDARAAWQKEDEDSKQREIDHEVEVAVTNAVAEAKHQWNMTNNAPNAQQAIESAVAVAEVKWLEQEQVKITRAVDAAVQVAKVTWNKEKQKEIARAVSEARQVWQANQEQELNLALEEASTQLMDNFDEQKREAVEMALREAKTLWHRHYDQNNNANYEALRTKLWEEFEETKRQELQETIEEERTKILQEQEAHKQDEINRAIAYMESNYAKSLEEFKHKELRTVLAEAREEWEKEQESEFEDIVKKRIDVARDEWFQSLDTSSRTEVERALATAREAWAAEYEDEIEDRVNTEVDRVRENILSEMEETKRKEIDEALRTCRKQFEATERRLKDEINRLKVIGSPQSLRKQYEQQISKLKAEHQQEYDRLREEHDELTRMVRESVEAEFDQKLVAVLHDAKQLWEEEQEEDRIQLEDQHNQKIKAVLENARQQFLKDQERAVKSATDAATNRQKELLKVEKETHKLAVERMKEEFAKTKQNHEEQLELIARKHADEIKNLKSALDGKQDNQTQTPPKQDVHSFCDSSIGSIDQLTAMKTMHELRDSYLDTVAKIRDDVLQHVNQTKANAAKKIRSEVMKERHSTAKKLRRYYLQCLKQLLEEDKACSEMNKPSSSIEEKLERMSKVLNAVSPDPTPTKGQVTSLPKDPSSTTNTGAPNSDGNPSSGKLHARPGGYGPDGASDSPRPSHSEKPQGSQNVPVSTNKEASTIGNKTITLRPEKEPRRSLSDRPQGSQVSVNLPVKAKGSETVILRSEKQTRDSSSGKPQGSQVTDARGDKTSTIPERGPSRINHVQVTATKPPPIQRRFAGSPALSVTSVESEQYTDLPYVIHNSNSPFTTVTTATTSPTMSSNVSRKNPVVNVGKATTSPIAPSNVNHNKNIAKETTSAMTSSNVNHNKYPVANVSKATTSPLSSPKSKLDEVKARAFARNQQSPKAPPISVSTRQRGIGPYDRGGGRSRDRYAPL